MHRSGRLLAVLAALVTGCSESGAASNFRTQACVLADQGLRTVEEREAIGRQALAIAEPMNGERSSRDTAEMLQLVLQLPALAAMPEGQTVPVPPVPQDSKVRLASSLEDALAGIRDVCERS